jgi:two-component system response regulator AlgR
MKVLIVDDEAPARARLQAMLESIDGYSSCGDAANGNEALALAEQAEPDILLMDIRMPGMDGLEAAQHLQSLEQPPAIIFTTAYNDYALQAFDTHAVDYLLKPVRQERLEEALQHARRLTRVQAAALQQAEDQPGQRQRICANVRGSLQLIAVDEIRYFHADQKYVTVCTADSQLLIEETLATLPVSPKMRMAVCRCSCRGLRKRWRSVAVTQLKFDSWSRRCRVSVLLNVAAVQACQCLRVPDAGSGRVDTDFQVTAKQLRCVDANHALGQFPARAIHKQDGWRDKYPVVIG